MISASTTLQPKGGMFQLSAVVHNDPANKRARVYDRFNLLSCGPMFWARPAWLHLRPGHGRLNRSLKETLPADMALTGRICSYHRSAQLSASGGILPSFVITGVSILAAAVCNLALPSQSCCLSPIAVFVLCRIAASVAISDLDVYAQIGLIMPLVFPQDAILIVDFAKIEHEKEETLRKQAIVPVPSPLSPLASELNDLVRLHSGCRAACGSHLVRGDPRARRILAQFVITYVCRHLIAIFIIPMLFVCGKIGPRMLR